MLPGYALSKRGCGRLADSSGSTGSLTSLRDLFTNEHTKLSYQLTTLTDDLHSIHLVTCNVCRLAATPYSLAQIDLSCASTINSSHRPYSQSGTTYDNYLVHSKVLLLAVAPSPLAHIFQYRDLFCVKHTRPFPRPFSSRKLFNTNAVTPYTSATACCCSQSTCSHFSPQPHIASSPLTLPEISANSVTFFPSYIANMYADETFICIFIHPATAASPATSSPTSVPCTPVHGLFCHYTTYKGVTRLFCHCTHSQGPSPVGISTHWPRHTYTAPMRHLRQLTPSLPYMNSTRPLSTALYSLFVLVIHVLTFPIRDLFLEFWYHSPSKSPVTTHSIIFLLAPLVAILSLLLGDALSKGGCCCHGPLRHARDPPPLSALLRSTFPIR